MKLGTRFFIVIVLCAVFAFSSCEKIIIQEKDEKPSAITGQGYGSSKLNIFMRATSDNSGENAITEGRIYIFDSTNKCLQLLSINEGNNQATVQLSAGSYTLYAVGSNELSRFSLPTQNEATPASVITHLEGQVMGDLLMGVANVDLEDGETLNQDLLLEHKVLCIDEVEIKQVPATVTKVEVSFSPLYSSVQLDGSYHPSPTESYKIALTKQDDGTTWKATPQQMLFPSKGIPTIKVSITTEEGTTGYSYNAAEELPANRHFTIIGTYKVAQGVSLTGILKDAGWDEDRTLTFDIDDSSIDKPLAGEFYKGYYVVTVNEVNHTAVLLSISVVAYDAPISGGATSDMWKQSFVVPMAALEKPENAIGSWRLPTLAEAELITKDPRAVTINEVASITIFCLDGDVLKWAEHKNVDGTYIFRNGTTSFNSGVYLKPVIDINY